MTTTGSGQREDLSISAEPSDLEAAGELLAHIHKDFAGDVAEDGGFSPLAGQHVSIALAALEQAACHLKLASYHQAAALAGG